MSCELYFGCWPHVYTVEQEDHILVTTGGVMVTCWQRFSGIDNVYLHSF